MVRVVVRQGFHCILFSKLIEAGAPRWCVRILCYWYCNQSLCVRWESVLSEFFPVNNGVRQGGIMSPLLFNLYVNDLSVQLQKLPVGCCCGDMVVNHLMYADDIVLLAPSGKGMQTIIDTTYAYGNAYDIIYIIIRDCTRVGAFPRAFCVPNSVALTSLTLQVVYWAIH